MGYVLHSTGSAELLENGLLEHNSVGWTLGEGWAWLLGALKFTGPGTEKVSNGSFTGSASGWTLGAALSYGVNNIAHAISVGISYDSNNTIKQNIGAIEGAYYVVSITLNATIGALVTIGQPNDDTTGSYSVDNTGGPNTYTFVIPAIGSDGFIYIAFAAGGTAGATLDNVTVKAVPVVQTVGANQFGRFKATVNVTGSVGNVKVFFRDASSPVQTLAAGSGVTTIEAIADEITHGGENSGFYVVPSDDFNGSINGITMKEVYVNSFGQRTGVSVAGDFIFRMKIGGAAGSVEVNIGGLYIHTFPAGSGNVSGSFSSGPPLLIEVTLTPTSDFDGTIDNVSLKLAGGGAELVNNGSFNGTEGWNED